jgi:hypothetical protein
VVWFLTESRRGPDYLFATAAVLLLRALDYPMRLCLGYYAAPDAYDASTDHTPVRSSDLHFWPEVHLSDGHWLVVEPGPGYEVLRPAVPLAERLLAALIALVAWVGQHWIELAMLLAGLFAAWFWRRELLDDLAVRCWSWSPGRTWREQVRRAVAVLERRGRWAGKARQRRQTIFSWLRETLAKPSGDEDIDQLTQMAQWAAYAPDVAAPWPEVEVRGVCQRVLGGWTMKRWNDSISIPARGTRP